MSGQVISFVETTQNMSGQPKMCPDSSKYGRSRKMITHFLGMSRKSYAFFARKIFECHPEDIRFLGLCTPPTPTPWQYINLLLLHRRFTAQLERLQWRKSEGCIFVEGRQGSTIWPGWISMVLWMDAQRMSTKLSAGFSQTCMDRTIIHGDPTKCHFR